MTTGGPKQEQAAYQKLRQLAAANPESQLAMAYAMTGPGNVLWPQWPQLAKNAESCACLSIKRPIVWHPDQRRRPMGNAGLPDLPDSHHPQCKRDFDFGTEFSDRYRGLNNEYRSRA